MIQKKIHYCWFGNARIPNEFQNFIANWKTLMPDYKVTLWNEANSPMHLPYMQKAHNHGNWANLSNYTRLYAVYHEGGIYLDTDVEVVKPFDHLLKNKCFFGLQQNKLDEINSFNNAIFGAEKGDRFIKKILDAYLGLYDGTEIAYLSSPHLTTYMLNQLGYSKASTKELIDNHVQIYPPEFFYPYHWDEEFSKEKVTTNTYTIHYWNGAWTQKRVVKKGKLKSIISRLFK